MRSDDYYWLLPEVFSERSHNKSFACLFFVRYLEVSLKVWNWKVLEGIGRFHCNCKINYYVHNSSIYWLNLLIFQNLLQKDWYQNLYNGTTQRVSSFCSGSFFCIEHFLEAFLLTDRIFRYFEITLLLIQWGSDD